VINCGQDIKWNRGNADHIQPHCLNVINKKTVQIAHKAGDAKFISIPRASMLFGLAARPLSSYREWSVSFLPRDARNASAVLLYRKSSVRLSVCPYSVYLSVTLRYSGHIGWTSSKVITRIISLGSSLRGYSRGSLERGRQTTVG